jgi:hypothetical protein
MSEYSSVTPSTPVLRKFVGAALRPIPLFIAAWGIALVAFFFSPFGGNTQPADSRWWTAPPSKLSGELVAILNEASRRGLSAREQITFVLPGGNSLKSSTVTVFSLVPGHSREDVFVDNTLHETKWQIHEASEVTEIGVQHKARTFQIQKRPIEAQSISRLERLRSILESLAGARRQTEPVELAGKQAVLFEVLPSTLEKDEEQFSCRVWLDIETKLPLRIEIDMRQAGGNDADASDLTVILATDDFKWSPEFVQNTFAPQIPEDYTASVKQ